MAVTTVEANQLLAFIKIKLTDQVKSTLMGVLHVYVVCLLLLIPHELLYVIFRM